MLARRIPAHMLIIIQLFLGMLAIGPWVLLLVYDAFLYIFRMATYDIPYVGGRARNRPRPRAPSLTARPNGKKRSVSLPIPPAIVVDAVEAVEDTIDGLNKKPNNKTDWGHRRNMSLAT